MNIIGTMSGLYNYDNNSPLTTAGYASLSQEQLWAFEPYWFQEANPRQGEFYIERGTDN